MPSAIQSLKNLFPPQTIIHIGAGTGNGEIHQWQQWGVPHALIIDADQIVSTGQHLSWPPILDGIQWMQF